MRRPSTSFALRALTLGAVAVTASGLLVAPATAAPRHHRHGEHGGHHGTTHRHLPRTVPLPDGLRPEGITSNGSRYYVGSLADGRIVTGSLLGKGSSQVLLRGAEGRQIRGLQYDRHTKLLWAVGNVGDVAHVWSIGARTGRVVSDTVVPGGVFLNDLVVTPRAVWVTDSGVERLTRIGLDRHGRATGAPTFLALGGDWPGAQGGNSANGIRLLDRNHVVLDHSTAGGLWSVDVRTGRASEILVKGGPAITGGDGLERRGSTLWVVRGTSDTSVAQLKLSHKHGGYVATWQKLLTDKTLDVPSTATFTLGSLWAVNARFGNPEPATASYYITRLR